MKKICFLIPDGTIRPATLFGVMEVFEKANVYAAEKNKKLYYTITLAGVNVRQNLLNGSLAIKVGALEDVRKQDMIIVPPIDEFDAEPGSRNKILLNWLIRQYASGAEVASLCTGAFFLAFTGLLKDKECSTHWRAGHRFIEMFPDVKLKVDKIITDNKGIYSAGGAHSSLNLALYLLEKHYGRDVALHCAKILQIDTERTSQSQFILFEGQKNHGDEDVKKIQLFIERNVEEKITVDYLAGKFAIAKRSLVRRFKKATNNAPVEYIQRIKVEAAKRSLESSHKTINEVMYSVGYNDSKAFRDVFKKIAGLTPIEYRSRYKN